MGLPDTSPRFSLLLDTPGLQIKELGLGEVRRRPWVLGAGDSWVLLQTLGHRCCGLLFPGSLPHLGLHMAAKATLTTLPAQQQMVEGCRPW